MDAARPMLVFWETTRACASTHDGVRGICLPPDGALCTQLARRLRELLGPADRVPSAHTAATRDGKGIVFVSSTGDVYPAGFLRRPVRWVTRAHTPPAAIRWARTPPART